MKIRIIKQGISPLNIPEYFDENNQPHNAWFYPVKHTMEIDLADLYDRYEDYKIKINTEPIDSDYEPISFSRFTRYYVKKQDSK
jgi:hypothetical protein